MVTFVIASAQLPKLGEALASVLAQTEAARIARIVVLGPDRFGLLPDHPLIVHEPDLPPGPAGQAYNRGIALAQSEFVVLMDADCVLSPGWLRQTQARHAEGWDAVAGGVIVPPGSYLATAYNYASFSADLATAKAGPRNFLSTMNLSLRRSVAAAVGAVREDMPRWYDLEWTLRMRRAGFRLLFDPAATVRHFPCYVTPSILWRTGFANGSSGQAVRRAFADLVPGSRWLDHPWLLMALSPAVATAVSARIIRAAPRDPRMWASLPMVWLSKLAWCLGASAGRRHGAMRTAEYHYEPPPLARDPAKGISSVP